MMSQRSIKYFIARTLLAALPLALLVVGYVTMDPFRVLRHYDDGAGEGADTVRMATNAGWVAVTGFERYQPQHKFDSFILGSSMSQNFRADLWQQHLPAGSHVYHMDQAMETIEGMTDKLRWLLSRGDTVRNALIVIEEEMLHRSPLDDDFLYARPPQTVPSPFAGLQFHLTAFNLFKDPEFLGWLLLDRDIHSALGKRFTTTDVPDRIAEINESRYTHFDSLIAVNPDEYYTPERLRRIAWTIEPNPVEPAIDAAPRGETTRHSGVALSQLLALRGALNAHRCAYTIIVVPRYHREPLHPADRLTLCEVFGSERIHDYSHDIELATCPRYYYDHSAHPTAATCSLLLHRSLPRP